MENFGIFLIQVKFYMYDHLLGVAEWGKLKVCVKHATLEPTHTPGGVHTPLGAFGPLLGPLVK